MTKIAPKHRKGTMASTRRIAKRLKIPMAKRLTTQEQKIVPPAEAGGDQ